MHVQMPFTPSGEGDKGGGSVNKVLFDYYSKNPALLLVNIGAHLGIYRLDDLTTNTIKIIINITVRESDHLKTDRCKIFGAFLIAFLIFLIDVLTAVNFDNKFGFVTVEIDNVRTNSFLSVKFEREF